MTPNRELQRSVYRTDGNADTTGTLDLGTAPASSQFTEKGSTMSDQIPLPAGANLTLPRYSIDDGALLKFGKEINGQLKDLETRFFVPRTNPRAFMGVSRKAPRKPR